MQNNIEKTQQLPNQVVAEQSQQLNLDVAISNFFKCYTLEDTENRIFRMLDEWIYDNGFKQSVSEADDAKSFINCLKTLLDVALSPNVKVPFSLASSIEGYLDAFGADSQMLDDFLQCWIFSKNNEPELIDIANNVAHCFDLVKLTRVLATEGGVSC